MSSEQAAISVQDLSKCYQIYDQPRDRLKQFLLPRIRATLGQAKAQYYKEFWALRNVSFSVKPGEAVGIIGRNGSGKSTLLQLICGTLNATAGSITTSGRIAALLELGSGFNPEFTGRENVYLNGAILGLSEADIDERFENIVAFAEIGEFLDQPVKTYSSGMTLRLAFSVAIHVDPQILVVDEALSVGDELFQRKCFSRIQAIRDSGATILFVSHSGAQVIELCDRAVLLDAGDLLATGPAKQVVGYYQKLLYAPAADRQAIRSSIIAGHPEPATDTAQPASDKPASDHIAVTEANDSQQDSFDANLVPTSRIDYESNGARIQSVSIVTMDGRAVNNLIRGNSYRYTYRVQFTRSASDVRFSMLIKTTSGMELGGAFSTPASQSSLPFAAAGSEYEISFTFQCALNAGMYFLNCGVLGEADGTSTYLHRIVDAAAFRVLPEQDNLATGTVDFQCRPRVVQASHKVA